MRVRENRCRNCDAPAYPCLGAFCQYRNYEAIYCDNPSCGAEVEKPFIVDGNEYCEECYNKLYGDEEEEEE